MRNQQGNRGHAKQKRKQTRCPSVQEKRLCQLASSGLLASFALYPSLCQRAWRFVARFTPSLVEVVYCGVWGSAFLCPVGLLRSQRDLQSKSLPFQSAKGVKQSCK